MSGLPGEREAVLNLASAAREAARQMAFAGQLLLSTPEPAWQLPGATRRRSAPHPLHLVSSPLHSGRWL